MNAKDVMSREPRVARTADRLDAVARILWENDCGIVPIVDAGGLLAGVVTDRDLCMASYTQGRTLVEIPVTAVMSRSVRTCRADEPVAAVLATMQQAQVHRLPVVDARGVVLGIVSTNDLVRLASQRPAALDPNQVVRTLAAIGQPRQAGRGSVAAAAADRGEPGKAATTAAAAASSVIAPAKPAKPGKAKAKSANPKGRKA